MPSDRVSELYNGEIFSRETQQACRDRINWMCAQVEGNQVLDVGCSQGIASLLLGRQGYRVVGIDVDPEPINYALQALEKEPECVKQNVAFQVTAPDPLPFADRSFDTVLLGEIIEHQTRPMKLLAEVQRVLRPGGRVIVTTPFGVHPSEGHVRTFALSSFLDEIQRFFDMQDLRICDPYIYFVGSKSADEARSRLLTPDARQLLLLSEEAFVRKDQRHWDMRETLAKQGKALREELTKVQSELIANRKSLTDAAARLKDAEDRLGRGCSASVASVERVVELLKKAPDHAGLAELLDRANRFLTWVRAAPAADAALEYLPELVSDVVRLWEHGLKEADSQYETKRHLEIQRLEQQHQAAIAAQRKSQEGLLQEAEQKHRQAVQALQEQHQAALISQQKALEDQIADVQQRHQQAVHALQQDHQGQIDRLQVERAEELVAQRSAYDEQIKQLEHAHRRELEQSRNRHEEDLVQLRARHEEQIRNLQQTHQQGLNLLRQQYDANLTKQQDWFERRFIELRQDHQRELARIQQEHEQAICGERASHEQQMKTLTASHGESIARLEQRLAELRQRCARQEEETGELRRRYEQEVRELQQQRQATLAAQQKYQQAVQQAAATEKRLVEKHNGELAALQTRAAGEAARLKKERDEACAKLQAELKRVRSLQEKAQHDCDYWKSRFNTFTEYYKVEQQLRLEEVRYRLGDAFVRAWEHPKELVLLPGRFVKLFLAGMKRRRVRRNSETPESTYASPSTSKGAQSVSAASSMSPRAVAEPPSGTRGHTPSAATKAATGSQAAVPLVHDQPDAQPCSSAGASSSTRPIPRISSDDPSKPKPALQTAPAAKQAARAPGAELLDQVPHAPHIGMGCDPKATLLPRPAPGPKTRVAAILDEFSRDCFAPECDMITFRPDNWANVLRRSGAEMLLVESAWHGNDGSWQYRIASYDKNMGDELLDLLECCKRNGVPTVFWNKEDPVHFDRFIDKARLFDVILTTDSDCIPKYRERVGHDRVYALPFAAQPQIHNPIQTELRLPKACFAGTYYASRFEQRQDDIAYLLRPAMQYGLDIFDRMHDAVGAQKQQFQFPAEFRPAIRGRLDYGEMIKAYKRYRLFLNVNSVKDSPTMFSRRVFELLACGTPVVSTYSRGIEQLLGPNGVFIVRGEEEARRCISLLMNDSETWALAAALGIRSVLSHHTYADRFAAIREWAGIKGPAAASPRVAVTVPVGSQTDADALADQIARQTYPNLEVHLFATGDLPRQVRERMVNAARGRAVTCWNSGEPATDVFRQFLEATSAQIVCSMRADALYGDDYVDEAVMFLRIPEVDFIGKECHYRLADNGMFEVVSPDKENRLTDSVPSATLCARSDHLTPQALRQIMTEPRFRNGAGRVFSTYRYGFLAASPGMGSTSDTRWFLNGRGNRQNG
jgi:ubiquinone/menaquinone biosynthesis C-methylase UbiE